MKIARRLRRLHLWVPELSSAGGIQQYSRTLLRGLEELLPQTEIRVLAKNDLPQSFVARSKISFRSTGKPPAISRTARFCALLVSQTLTQRPDLAIVTHLHFAPMAHVLNKCMGLRYWVAAHGLEAWGGLSPRMERALAGARKILPVSRYTSSRLLGIPNLDQGRCCVLPNAVDGDSFFPAEKPPHLLRRYGLRAEQKILFTLARLNAPDRYKGYDRVIDVLRGIRDRVPGTHYILAGRGPENERIRRRVRQLGLQNEVTLTGFLPDRDLRDHYNLCDVFVMPSVGEGFGIVYLEALACGLPPIAGNCDGSREPLLERELGVLVDPADPVALEEAVVRLLTRTVLPGHEYAPDYLRKRVLEQFGFGAFKERLRAALES